MFCNDTLRRQLYKTEKNKITFSYPNRDRCFFYYDLCELHVERPLVAPVRAVYNLTPIQVFMVFWLANRMGGINYLKDLDYLGDKKEIYKHFKALKIIMRAAADIDPYILTRTTVIFDPIVSLSKGKPINFMADQRLVGGRVRIKKDKATLKKFEAYL